MKIAGRLKKYDFLKVASGIAENLNIELFVIGGFVRDIILKRKIDDIDFLIIGDGIKFASVFAHNLGINDIVIFKNFGTAHFKYHEHHLEFVAARKESYSKKSRKPLVSSGTFEDDIRRRDFTINTIAVSLNHKKFGEVTDIFNGLEDINTKLIRTPVDPLITFDDDPLRILRAYRFASQLGFTVHKTIDAAAGKLKDRLEIVSQERITDEFFKILRSPKPSVGLKLIYYSGVLNIIFPEISKMKGIEQRDDYHHKDVFLHTCEVVDKVAEKSENVWLRFAALLHDVAKPQTKKFVKGTGWTFHGHDEIGARMIKHLFRRMKLPMNKIDYVENLVRLHLRPIALASDEVTDSAIRRLIVSAGENLDDLITLCRADITSKNPEKVKKYLGNYERVMKKVLEVKDKDRLRAFQSPVDGEVIMKVCSLTPSKKVGEIKKAIEDAILDGRISNTYDEAYQYLLEIKDDFLDMSSS